MDVGRAVLTERQLERFLSRVGAPDFDSPLVHDKHCREWTGRLDKDGYGLFDVGRDAIKAHRIALALADGPRDRKWEACHRCDNTKCCEPEHLYWGTKSDNMQDRADRGRQAGGRRTHERSLNDFLKDILKGS